MKPQYDTPAEFAADVVKNAKGAWVNGTYMVAGHAVGVKAYGLWVQRLNAHCLTDSGEFKTQRAMREFITAHIGY